MHGSFTILSRWWYVRRLTPLPVARASQGQASNQLSYVPAVRRVRLSATLNTLRSVVNPERSVCCCRAGGGVSLGVGQGVWGGVLIYAMALLNF
jgi:hypothetical protein